MRERGKPCTESTDIASNLPIWPLREKWEVQLAEVSNRNPHKNTFASHSSVCYRKTALLLSQKRGRTLLKKQKEILGLYITV